MFSHFHRRNSQWKNSFNSLLRVSVIKISWKVEFLFLETTRSSLKAKFLFLMHYGRQNPLNLQTIFVNVHWTLEYSHFLIFSGMPFDFMNIWLPNSYPFNEIVCILQGLLSETSTNATILTITSFTCERYIAICHPFR